MTSPISEIIFEVSEDEVDGGYSASALGYGIHTEGETIEEVRGNVREAVDCYFDDAAARPGLMWRLPLRITWLSVSCTLMDASSPTGVRSARRCLCLQSTFGAATLAPWPEHQRESTPSRSRRG